MKNKFYEQLIAFILLLFALSASLETMAQQQVQGNVADAKTGEPLAFVNIIINDGKYGGTSDIDGRFAISSQEPIHKLKFSFVGYEAYEYHPVDVKTKLKILLQPINFELAEIVIRPGINPAHRIIDSVLSYRDSNHPNKAASYSYTSYDKMVLTIDTLLAVAKKNPDTTVADSLKKARNFLKERDFFIMESVTEKKFLAPDRSHEKVLATKLSGFKDPIFVFLISQTQSSNFYDETIKITDKNYINPISKGSNKKYLFILEESTEIGGGDSLFSISYRPLLGTNFDGLKGVLNIHSDGWAIQNVTAQPYRDESGFSIRIQQMYEKINGIRWFPVQLNTDLLFKGAVADDGVNQYPMVGIGKSYFRDIVLNPELVKRQFSNIAIEVAPDATDKGDNYWLQYRIDSLNQRTAETYRYMDSIGQAHNFDRIAASLQTLQSGRIPIKMFDLNLDKLLGYNAYEGIYAGLGLQTNDKFSRAVKFGGFWGYGFRDQTAKYGLDVAVQIDRYKEISLEAAYSFEALESGGFTRFGENPFLIEQSKFRDFFINRKDITTTLMGGISFRALRHFKWRTFIEVQEKTNKTGYVFAEAGKLPTSTFRFTKLQLQTRFVFKEKFMQTTRGLISLGSSYPIVRLAYTKSFDDLLDGAYAFDKWEFKTNYAWFTPYLGKTDITLIAGLVEGNAPGTELFNASGTYRAFTFYAPESFGTMRTNEFLSDKFTALFFTHNFGKLLFRKGKFEPEFVLATNIAFGQLDKPLPHQGITFNTLEHGFYESGLMIDNLLKIPGLRLGLGAFYRFGSYGFDQEWKNFGYKFGMVFGF